MQDKIQSLSVGEPVTRLFQIYHAGELVRIPFLPRYNSRRGNHEFGVRALLGKFGMETETCPEIGDQQWPMFRMWEKGDLAGAPSDIRPNFSRGYVGFVATLSETPRASRIAGETEEDCKEWECFVLGDRNNTADLCRTGLKCYNSNRPNSPGEIGQAPPGTQEAQRKSDESTMVFRGSTNRGQEGIQKALPDNDKGPPKQNYSTLSFAAPNKTLTQATQPRKSGVFPRLIFHG